MNKKAIIILAAVALFASACGINDLEDRLDKVENAIGANEPLYVEYTTQDNESRDISLKREYLFKASGGYNNFIQINSDTEYEVYVERFSDALTSEGAWIYFLYNPQTKEVTNQSARVYYYTRFGNWIRPTFDIDYEGQTVNFKVNAVDAAKGFIDVELTSSTTAESPFNTFSGKSMTGLFRFKGTAEVYDVSDQTNLRIHR